MADKGKEPKGKMSDYTPDDNEVIKESKDTKDSFKRGGRMKKRKHGGNVGGHAPHMRLDKRAGGGPLSTAAKVKGRPGCDYGASVDREDD